MLYFLFYLMQKVCGSCIKDHGSKVASLTSHNKPAPNFVVKATCIPHNFLLNHKAYPDSYSNREGTFSLSKLLKPIKKLNRDVSRGEAPQTASLRARAREKT